MLKALAIHTASESDTGSGPNAAIGYGAYDGYEAAWLIKDEQLYQGQPIPLHFTEGTVRTGEPFMMEIPFRPFHVPCESLIITVCWTDPPCLTHDGPTDLDNDDDKRLVNDLDVTVYEVQDPTVIHYPWTLYNASTAIQSANSRNNVEQVFLSTTELGNVSPRKFMLKIEANGELAAPQIVSIVMSGADKLNSGQRAAWRTIQKDWENKTIKIPTTPTSIRSETTDGLNDTEPHPKRSVTPLTPRQQMEKDIEESRSMIKQMEWDKRHPGQSVKDVIEQEKRVIAPGKFKFTGVGALMPILYSGIVSDVASTTITLANDDGVIDLVEQLGETGPATTGSVYDKTYILELANGVTVPFTEWDEDGVITLPEDITADVTEGETLANIRVSTTIADIFGENNEAGLVSSAEGDALNDGSDLIEVPQPDGSFVTVYYYDDGQVEGWYTMTNGAAADFPIFYPRGFFLDRSAVDSEADPVDVLIAGYVKTYPTRGTIRAYPSFTYASSVTPFLTLGNSGLKDYLNNRTSSTDEDIDFVMVQDANGDFDYYYYGNISEYPYMEWMGWVNANTMEAADAIPLGDAFLISPAVDAVARPYVLNPNGWVISPMAEYKPEGDWDN